jgi:transposase-like protein
VRIQSLDRVLIPRDASPTDHVDCYSSFRRGTQTAQLFRRPLDPRAAFLHRLTEKHDVADAEFLVDAGGYLTALFRQELSGRLKYRERNHIGKWFQTVAVQIDRFHSY